jgi:hypothetical protein
MQGKAWSVTLAVLLIVFVSWPCSAAEEERHEENMREKQLLKKQLLIQKNNNLKKDPLLNKGKVSSQVDQVKLEQFIKHIRLIEQN